MYCDSSVNIMINSICLEQGTDIGVVRDKNLNMYLSLTKSYGQNIKTTRTV